MKFRIEFDGSTHKAAPNACVVDANNAEEACQKVQKMLLLILGVEVPIKSCEEGGLTSDDKYAVDTKIPTVN